MPRSSMAFDSAHPTAAERDQALLALARVLQTGGYRHTTVTPATHARVNDRTGNEWARDLRGVFGWSRPFRAELLPAGLFELMRRADVVAPHKDGWRSRIRLSSLDQHLFVHSAYPTSDADAVFFGPDTYRFVAALRTHLERDPEPVRRAVDIGAGSGAGAIALASARPEAEVLAVDINPAALRLTRINAAVAGTGKVRAAHSDLLSGVDGRFDLIVANPPYLVDPARRAYRHGGGPLGAGLALAIVDAAIERLAPGGRLLLYTGAAIVDGNDPFRAAAEAKLAAAGLTWDYREMDPDVFGEELDCEAYATTERIAAVVLTAYLRS